MEGLMSEKAEERVTITIDGKQIKVPAGTNIIEAASLAGVEIPHYCYHPHLSVAGAHSFKFSGSLALFRAWPNQVISPDLLKKAECTRTKSVFVIDVKGALKQTLSVRREKMSQILKRKSTFTLVVSYWPKLIEFFWCKVPLGWK